MIFERLACALGRDEPVALVTQLDGGGAGRKLLVLAAETLGDLGTPGLTDAATREAQAMLASGTTALRRLGPDGGPVGNEVRIFVQSFASKPAMYVFGAIDFSRAMARIGRFLGYRVTVVDARPVFATRDRVPDADEVVVAWPDDFLARAPIDERTVLVILTHDVKFDVPLLELAVRTPACYIGAMGSRRTHAARLAALRAAGVGEAALARINGPAGLDIGARTPEETAISIAGEIIARREGRGGQPLVEGTLPVHNARREALLR